MYIAILGRQPALSMAELEQIYGPDHVAWFSRDTATVSAETFAISRLGGTLKAGHITIELASGDWRRASMEIVRRYTDIWSEAEGKITLGISAYGFDVAPRDVQKTGILLKEALKKTGTSLRLIPNTDTQLNTATSHHNKLGLSPNKVELLVVRGETGRIIIAESTGAQNITALAARDQVRPKRDPFVGMLPPKLAQIMINLTGLAVQQRVASGRAAPAKPPRLLDPFCGTGVILQEAALMGYAVYGTDLSDKMVDYTKANLTWLADSHRLSIDATVHQADATEARWQPPINVVVAEAYLGQPFSAPPSPAKLEEVKKNVDRIITAFLKNIGQQLHPGTPLCLAVPAWRDTAGRITHLPFLIQLKELGYDQQPFSHVSPGSLIYYREDQVVARELLVLVKR
jgi:tRNA G10  N-methylase Trm11